ncbi:hypothetical protein B566_EDAN008958 [Ephemera danica]|nr:hypothetical protein B566_EDAN008958 [Ephemera danica]
MEKLGGPDPLDYISMYSNPGIPEQNIPPHWHYISFLITRMVMCFGLSDLHGDGRVHEVSGPGGPSGYGFELTFRLKREPEETAPPTWPAALLQALAKYVFQSENALWPGDHVSWHSALDGSESRLQHMLMAPDPQLGQLSSPTGTVAFTQVVGICAEELRVAQHWNGPGVIDILRRLPGAGGPWLVVDMRRGESMLELDPSVADEVARGINTDGSNLSGVSARCWWAENGPGMLEALLVREEEESSRPTLSEDDSLQIKAALKKGLLSSRPLLPPARNQRNIDLLSASQVNLPEDEGSETSELTRVKTLETLQLTFNLEAGSLLPLAIRGRVLHGRHFTFKSVLGDSAITLVAPSVTGTFVDPERRYAAHGAWLQVLVPEHLAQDMASSLDELTNPEQVNLVCISSL